MEATQHFSGVFIWKRAAFIKNQAPKCWCANRIIWLCIWHTVTLPAMIALERSLASCGIAPCSCWTPGSMRNLDLQLLSMALCTPSGICRAECTQCVTMWRWPGEDILTIFQQLNSSFICNNPPPCLRWHLILVCICFVVVGWAFFPTNPFVWLREILNIHDFLVITVWAWPPVCICRACTGVPEDRIRLVFNKSSFWSPQALKQ